MMVGTAGMGPLRIEAADEDEHERIMKRFEKLGRTLMNRTQAGGFQGDPVASVLGDRFKNENAAAILGQAFAIAYNFIRENKDAVERIANEVIAKQEIYGNDLVGLLDRQNLRKPEIDWTKEESWPRI
jgi:ATP-dependent Zn protease